MTTPDAIQGERIASALKFLGINFVLEDQFRAESLHQHPARLIKALAQSKEARLRLSIIPLLLDHPEFSSHVRRIAIKLTPPERLTLQCYYTAALFFQQKYQPALETKKQIPDLFSKELSLECSADPAENLKALAVRQQILSGAKINWLGTYRHAIKFWMKDKELDQNINA